MKLSKIIALLLVLSYGLIGCSDGQLATKYNRKDKDYLVTIQTNKGTMKAILYDKTPKHKENFIKLSEEGFYDSLLFHRVIKGFMVQGGDPESKGAEAGKRLGGGGPGYRLPAEMDTSLFHQKGALAAARQGDNVNPEKESNGSQFYIVHGNVSDSVQLAESRMNMQLLYQLFVQFAQKPENAAIAQQYQEAAQTGGNQGAIKFIMRYKDQLEESSGQQIEKPMSPAQMKAYTTVGGVPFLDQEYTVFGQVIHGLEIIDSLASAKKDGADRPTEDLWMVIDVQLMRKSDIAKEYGYYLPANENL